MSDMAEATSAAASVASNAGVSIEQLSAMIGTVEARTKLGGSEVGNALKALLVNLTNVNSRKIVDTLDKAGASMTEYVDGAERLRNPIDILRDLAETYNQLDENDPLKAEITTNIGQKYHANKLAALLTGWEDYEKMLQDYSEGSGSAYNEAMKSANNWEGSLNRLSNTFTDFIGNFANSDAIIKFLNILNGGVTVLDKVTEKLGGLGTAATAIAGVLGAKGMGLNYNQVIYYKAPFCKVA